MKMSEKHRSENRGYKRQASTSSVSVLTTPPTPSLPAPSTINIPLEDLSHHDCKHSKSPPEPSLAHNKQKSSKSSKRIRTMLTNDWLADMVNNNVSNTDAGGGGGHPKPSNVMIELKNVHIRDPHFRGGHHFRSLNVSIPLASIFAIVGSARTGKSLLLETIAGIRQPSRGKVKCAGPDRKRPLSLGLMPQRDGYLCELSPLENVQFVSRLYSVKSIVMHSKLHQLMQLIGWDKKHIPLAKLSSIHQSLTALALATLHSPAILLLDEPNFGADLFMKEHIWRQLKKLTTTEYVTIVFTTSVVEDVRFAHAAAYVRAKTLLPINLVSTQNEIEPEGNDSTPGDAIHNMLTLDVDKIRTFLRHSYQLRDDVEDNNNNGNAPDKHTTESSNKAFQHAETSGSLSSSEVQLSMSSWASSPSVRQHYNETQLKRVRRIQSSLGAFCLMFCLLVKQSLKEPFFLVAQFILPAAMIGVFNYFVGQNPIHIPVGIYNPDAPAIVSKHVLSKLDQHTIEPVYFDTLETALLAARRHEVWAVVEFPSNYTNSMINRAIQNCENSVDEFEDEPEAETIDKHEESRLLMRTDRIKLVADNTRRARASNQSETEVEETNEDDKRDRNNDADEEDEKEVDNKDLINDVDVNRKKIRPVNIITVRVYVDNTNLLISGFIKGKLFQALQLAQQDANIQSFAPKIPSPLEIISPNIYGEDETPMAEFLIAGLTIVVVFLCSSLFPLKCLHRLETHSMYSTMRIAGLGHFTLILSWWCREMVILSIQTSIIVLTITTATSIRILGPMPLIYALLVIQGAIAITQAGVIMLTLAGKSLLRCVCLQMLVLLTLVTIGGLLWPAESVPRWFGGTITRNIPQSMAAETLRAIISRGWSYQHYWHHDDPNDIVWRGVNLPLAWLGLLILMAVARIKLSNLN